MRDVLVKQRGAGHVVLDQLRHLQMQQEQVYGVKLMYCTGQTAGMECIEIKGKKNACNCEAHLVAMLV
jgi:hypothetical protein